MPIRTGKQVGRDTGDLVCRSLWAMAKQVPLPAARRVDDVIAKAGAQPVLIPDAEAPNVRPGYVKGETSFKTEAAFAV